MTHLDDEEREILDAFERGELKSIADLDGKRMHWKIDDDRMDDDTLGSDFDVACNGSGLNYWNGPDCSRAYGEINVDFHCIEGSTFKIEASFALSKNEDEMEDDEEEITVMRITITGENSKGRPETIAYDLYDEYNAETGASSMARTTGYTATAAANMFLEGLFTEKGVFPPELIGKHEECYEFMLGYLEERGIYYKKKVIN